MDIKLHIVGSNPSREILSLANNRITVYGKVTDEELKNIYNSIRIVIIPLRYGAGVKGKTIEAMLNQVPFVGTKYAIQGLPEKEEYFKSYDTEESFKTRLLELYNNEDIWNKERKNYHTYLKKYFSYDKASQIIKQFYE